jgi:hypothetical protein
MNSSPLICCDRCGFDQFVDAPIHNGESVRRDCARCKTTMGFAVWYGQAVELEQTPGPGVPSPLKTCGEMCTPGATVTGHRPQ